MKIIARVLLLFGLLAALYVAVILLGSLRLKSPEYQFVGPNAFVYSDGGRPVLVLPTGRYKAPEPYRQGCYRVERDSLAYAWPACARQK